MGMDPRTTCERPVFWRGGVVDCMRCGPCVAREPERTRNAAALRELQGLGRTPEEAEAAEIIQWLISDPDTAQARLAQRLREIRAASSPPSSAGEEKKR